VDADLVPPQPSTTTSISSLSFPGVEVSYADLWHARLGHCGRKAIHHLVQQKLLPPSPSPSSQSAQCDSCVQAKQRRVSRKPAISLARSPLQRLHVDLTGPINTLGFRGERFLMLEITFLAIWLLLLSLGGLTLSELVRSLLRHTSVNFSHSSFGNSTLIAVGNS
jgi:hypothetical protein